jgi:hypothetical protein
MISVMAPYWGKLFPDVSDTTIYNLGNVLCRAYNVICTLLFTISVMAPYCGKLFSDTLVVIYCGKLDAFQCTEYKLRI